MRQISDRRESSHELDISETTRVDASRPAGASDPEDQADLRMEKEHFVTLSSVNMGDIWTKTIR